MKKFFLINIIIFTIFLNTVNAEQKIVFLDMDRIVSTSNAGLSIINQLKELSDKNLILLNKQEKNFKEKETKLISQKNIISESEFTNKANKLKKEINMLNKNRNKIITDFNKLKIENTNKLLKMVNPVLIKFSNDNSISFILQKKDLVIGKSELDITDEILKIINNEVKIFKIK
jgi:Skp family chaperone for outer membrane proteins